MRLSIDARIQPGPDGGAETFRIYYVRQPGRTFSDLRALAVRTRDAIASSERNGVYMLDHHWYSGSSLQFPTLTSRDMQSVGALCDVGRIYGFCVLLAELQRKVLHSVQTAWIDDAGDREDSPGSWGLVHNEMADTLDDAWVLNRVVDLEGRKVAANLEINPMEQVVQRRAFGDPKLGREGFRQYMASTQWYRRSVRAACPLMRPS